MLRTKTESIDINCRDGLMITVQFVHLRLAALRFIVFCHVRFACVLKVVCLLMFPLIVDWHRMTDTDACKNLAFLSAFCWCL